MGIVIRQGVFSSIISYFGVGLGYIATLMVFPEFLNVDQIGLIRLIQSNGLMLIPLATLGMPSYWILKFPEISNDSKELSIISSFLIFTIVLANSLLVLSYFILKDPINSFFISESPEYIKYISISFIILISQSIFDTLGSFYRTHLNISIPGYFKEIHLRLFNLLIIVAFGFAYLNFENAIYLISLNYISTTIFLLIILMIKYQFKFTFRFFNFKKIDIRSLTKYGGYFAFLSIGNSIISNVGFLLTSTYLGLEANGIYATCLYIGVIIEMPRRAASQILTPLISKSFNEDDHDNLKDIYYRSSINLALISFLLFIGIVTNVNDLFYLIPKGEVFREGYIVVLLVGISKVIGMSFGATGEFLTYSPYKRYNLYVMLSSSLIMILSTIILIPKFGISGAAYGMLISLLFNQLLSFYFMYTKLNLSPFRVNHIKLIIISVVVFFAAYTLSINLGPLLNIIVRSVLTSIVFIGLIYLFKISKEVNQLITKSISLLK